MYVLSYVKQGLGNKIYLFCNIVYFFLQLKKYNPEFTKLYLAVLVSKHEKEDPDFISFEKLFFNIQKYDWIEFVTFKKFDILKEETVEVKQDIVTPKLLRNEISKLNSNILFTANFNLSNIPFTEYPTLFTDMCKIKPNLMSRYNYRNSIFVHIRYGDKLKLLKERKAEYVVLKPQFYFDAIEELKSKINSSKILVYIFTDSPELVSKSFLPELSKMEGITPILCDEPYYNIYYLAQKFSYMVLSDSSLVYAGINLNKNLINAIAFKYITLPLARKMSDINFYPNKPTPVMKYKRTFMIKNPLNQKSFILYDNFEYLF